MEDFTRARIMTLLGMTRVGFSSVAAPVVEAGQLSTSFTKVQSFVGHSAPSAKILLEGGPRG